MATDIERLVVQLSADVRSYENAMAKATGITRTQLKQLKAEAANTGEAAGAAFVGAAGGVKRFGDRAAVAAKQAGALRAQAGNLSAQFQDIAVQLQMGQSPFQIALQQGTQISAVLGATGGGAAGAVKALGGAFASLISPVSLVTIGLIAAGGAAVQYFSGMLDDGEKSAEDLKRQADMIKRVAAEWGDAVPAIRAYADEVERATREGEIRGSAEIVNAKLYDLARERVAALADQLVVLRGELESLVSQNDAAKISELQSAFNDLEKAVQENRGTAEDAERVQKALAAVMDLGAASAATFAGSLENVRGGLASVAAQARDTTAATEALINSTNALNNVQAARAAAVTYRRTQQSTEDFVREQERINSLTAEQLRLEQRRDSLMDEARRSGGNLDIAEAERLAAQDIAASKRRAEEERAARAASRTKTGGGGRDKAASEAEREREAVMKLIEQLRFEQTLIGMTDEQRQVATALRRAGAAATAEQRAEIEALVKASYAETEALRATEEQMQQLKSLSKDVLGGMFEDLRNGASAADLLANALNRVAESLVQSGIDRMIEGMFAGGSLGGGTGGGIGNILARLFHQGGVVGRGGPTRSVPAAAFVGAPRFHNGGEVPALLLPGERVLNRRETAAYNRGGDVTVQLIGAGAQEAKVEQSRGPDGRQTIKIMLRDQWKALAAEGAFNGDMQRLFGVSRVPLGR